MNLSITLALLTNWVAVLSPAITGGAGRHGHLEFGLVRTNVTVLDQSGVRVGALALTNVAAVLLRTNWGTSTNPAIRIHPGAADARGLYRISNSPLQVLVGRGTRQGFSLFEVSYSTNK